MATVDLMARQSGSVTVGDEGDPERYTITLADYVAERDAERNGAK